MPMTEQDARLVVDAANDGRIDPGNVPEWLNAMRADPERTRVTLASLRSVRRDVLAAAGIDPEIEVTHHKVLQRLGIQSAPRTVAASAELTPYQRAVRNADGFGQRSGERLADPFAKPDIPAPVRIQRGKPMSEYTDQERADALQRQLGPRFYPGTQPPPKGDKWFQPSMNQPYEFDEATGQWRENPNYRPGD